MKNYCNQFQSTETMDDLPAEIIVHILSFLPAGDLIHVSQVNKRINELIGHQQLLRVLDLRQAYSCSHKDLKIFLRRRCHMVHTLEMDGVYWFKPPFDTIARMNNLKSLHLRGISLTFHQLHKLLGFKLPLQELSIDWPKCSQQHMKVIEEMQEGLSHLKFLCLTIVNLSEAVVHFLNQCTTPFRLVLYYSAFVPVDELPMRWDFIITGKLESLTDQYAHDVDGKEEVRCSFDNQVMEVGYSWLRITVNFIAELKKYPNLKGLSLNLECHPQIIELGDICEAFPQLQWFWLHFKASDRKTRMAYVQHISTLHHLTRLSLPMHIFCETYGTEKVCETSATPKTVYTSNFKRLRLGVSSSEEDAEAGILNLIIDNCPLLIVLEIGVEDSIPSLQSDAIYWHSLRNIRKLKRLTHLSLCNIPVTNGSFLCEIAVGCPRIKSLKLGNLGPDGKCCYLKELTDSVTQMSCLTDFSIHQQYIAPATALFKALNKCLKLQRLSISAIRDMLPLDLCALEQLIKAQPSLIFVSVKNGSTPQTACQKFTRKLKAVSRPALVILANNNTKERMSSIPFTHHDMIERHTWRCKSSCNRCHFHSPWCGSLHGCYQQDFSLRHYAFHVGRGHNKQIVVSENPHPFWQDIPSN